MTIFHFKEHGIASSTLLEGFEKGRRYTYFWSISSLTKEASCGGEILAILEEKAKEGLDVRVMFDGMNEMTTLSYDYILSDYTRWVLKLKPSHQSSPSYQPITITETIGRLL